MKNVKVVIYETIQGTKLSLYKKHWLLGWQYEGGLKPINNQRLFESLSKEEIDQWKRVYGDELPIVDKRKLT